MALAAAVSSVGLYTFRNYEPDPSKYPVRGVDVSHHQGPVDWPRVARHGVAFAYLKASEGRDHRDDLFDRNWRGARAAGLRVGAYHYFTFCSSGRAQAANFLAAVPREADALPVAVDLEFGGNCGSRPAGPALARELAVFLAMVEAREGRPAILYVTPEFLAAYRAVLPDRSLWRRSILHAPARGEPWVLWQFHNRGKVDGVTGPVDISVFAGDRRAWARFGGQARVGH
ncbi:MAG: glycosyl hydrolase 25 family protein lysozyme [Caulobacter sp.]|nr:glycosyl hydrolase 25 family protein lysozyme [Caulobacter sp.]